MAKIAKFNSAEICYAKVSVLKVDKSTIKQRYTSATEVLKMNIKIQYREHSIDIIIEQLRRSGAPI